MKHLTDYLEFILENTDRNIELVDDCFLEFCDTYNLDIDMESGFMVNGSYLPGGIIPEALLLAKETNIDITLEDCYKVALFSKKFREGSYEGDLEIKWKEEINVDFKNCIKRVTEITNLKVNYIPTTISPSFLNIIFYLSSPYLS